MARTARRRPGRASARPAAAKKATSVTRRGKKKLGRGRRAATGIEIGTFSVKIVSLHGDDAGEIDIRKITVVPLDQPGSTEYPEELQERQKKALKEAYKQHGSLEGTIVLGFPRHLVTVRYLNLPSSNPEELREMLYFDVERHVPFALEEMEISFQIMEKLGDHESRVMIVCVPRKEIEPYVEMCRDLGINLDRIDLDVCGDCEVYKKSLDPEKTVALVNFGRSSVKLSILKDGLLVFSRSLPVSETQLLKGFPGAKSWRDLQGRVTAAGPLNPNEREHFADWVETLSLELMRSVSAFSCEHDAATVDRMILLGGAGYFPSGPPRGLNVRIKTNTTIESPLNGEIPVSDEYHGCTIATPTGLAIRGLQQQGTILNLLPESVVQEREHQERSAFRKNVFILVFMIVTLLGGATYLNWYKQYLDYAALDQFHRERLPEFTQFKKMKDRVETVEKYLDSDSSCVNVLHSVLQILPQKCYIQSLTFNKRKSLEMIIQVPTIEDWQKINQQLINLSPPNSTKKYFRKIVPTIRDRQLDLLATQMNVQEVGVTCEMNYEEQR